MELNHTTVTHTEIWRYSPTLSPSYKSLNKVEKAEKNGTTDERELLKFLMPASNFYPNYVILYQITCTWIFDFQSLYIHMLGLLYFMAQKEGMIWSTHIMCTWIYT